MDIKTLCLGLLCRGEASGYDLKKQFESTFNHFYPAGYGSIYPSLADLLDNELVECQSMAQEKKPDRKVYRITEAGRRKFVEALHGADPQQKMRSEYLVVAYFSKFIDPDSLRAMLARWQQNLDAQTTHFEEARRVASDSLTPQEKFVNGFGAAIAKAMADYLRDNKELLVESSAESRQQKAIAASSTTQNIHVENRA